ncbi:bacterial regulatory s, tetR family protein [Mycobacteroides abscessus]|nr:bacterial regulatory s, tetR family protein [Mycobacteroides abscessus]
MTRELDHVQMHDVAKHANVAIGTLYRYFPTKRHLFVSALVRRVRTAGRRLPSLPDGGQAAADRIRVATPGRLPPAHHRATTAVDDQPFGLRVPAPRQTDDAWVGKYRYSVRDGHVRVLGDIVHLNVGRELARHRELFGAASSMRLYCSCGAGSMHGGWPHR